MPNNTDLIRNNTYYLVLYFYIIIILLLHIITLATITYDYKIIVTYYYVIIKSLWHHYYIIITFTIFTLLLHFITKLLIITYAIMIITNYYILLLHFITYYYIHMLLLRIIIILLLYIITYYYVIITTLLRRYYIIITNRKSCINDSVIACYAKRLPVSLRIITLLLHHFYNRFYFYSLLHILVARTCRWSHCWWDQPETLRLPRVTGLTLPDTRENAGSLQQSLITHETIGDSIRIPCRPLWIQGRYPHKPVHCMARAQGLEVCHQKLG